MLEEYQRTLKLERKKELEQINKLGPTSKTEVSEKPNLRLNQPQFVKDPVFEELVN